MFLYENNVLFKKKRDEQKAAKETDLWGTFVSAHYDISFTGLF